MDKSSLESMYQDYVNSMLQSGAKNNDILIFDDFCASANKELKREHKIRLPLTDTKLSEEEAASIIQRAWRRHIDVQVYRYYRDLINFKQKGDPAQMLRSINPREAELLDPASGVHVKFRLAGEKFPPNIYYKIFTHRPVQDLCANSPKDYTKPTAKLLTMRQMHNRTDGDSKEEKVGWYQRTENNGWRLVSDRMVAHLFYDPVTWDTSHQSIQFHHSKLQRRQDVEQRRKKKKIDWMRKLYLEGHLQSKTSDPETAALVDGAARGMLEAVRRKGETAVDDWEVDELLNWTTGLNFDDYMLSWKEIATTAGSETKIEASQQIYQILDESTLVEDTVVEPSQQRSGYSHNTPVSGLSGMT